LQTQVGASASGVPNKKATPDVAPIAAHGLQVRCNNRFAYVSVSRAQHDAHIYTNDGNNLSRDLRRESSQRTAKKWNGTWLRRRPNRLASKGDSPPKRSKVIV